MAGRTFATGALLAGCLTVLLSSQPALAAGGCRHTAATAEDLAICVRATCAGRAGKAQRACVRACQPAPIRTLAYAVTRCREDPRGVITRHQEVRIRRGDCPPVTVFSIDPPNLPDPFGSTCRGFGLGRAGNYTMMLVGLISRIDVNRGGSEVVFEVTDDFSFLNRQQLPPEQEGIYLVRADGSGLRRLGPASRDPPFRVAYEPRLDAVITAPTVDPHLNFSPDGRRIVFTDRGPGPGGEAVQLVTIELASGRRTQITHLPPVAPPIAWHRDTGFPRFTDNDTVLFGTYADADGAHPAAETFNLFTVKTDGTGLRAVAAPVVLPGSHVQQVFQITGGGGSVVSLLLPGMPANPFLGFDSIFEVFLIDGKNVVQLTTFGRRDTGGTGGELLSIDRRRVFFRASADPLGTNPSENCQLFSVDRFGRHLRQITHFGPSEGARSVGGCGTAGPFPPGCDLATFIQDPVTRTLVFISSCDPLGRNPYGGQLFAMRPDGSGLRQLTASPGLVIEADGTVDTELPGPFWYSGRRD